MTSDRKAEITGRSTEPRSYQPLSDQHRGECQSWARVDLERAQRTGLPEVIFAAGKTDDQISALANLHVERQQHALATRVEKSLGLRLEREIVGSVYHPDARVWAQGCLRSQAESTVAIVTAGTSDLPVAAEAQVTAHWLGLQTTTHYDVGVAGLQRLLDQLDTLRSANSVIAVAGMDGALPTVIAGLIPAPVVAVPTSVGYGACFDGLAPLLTMLTACAPGVAVVNIDNGFGAAALAAKMAKPTQRQSPG